MAALQPLASLPFTVLSADGVVVYRDHYQRIRLWDIPNTCLSGAIRGGRDNLPGFYDCIRQPRPFTAHLRGLIAYLHDAL